MTTVLKDLKYAFRGLRRSPGFTLVAVLALAIGIGANSAIFSVVNAVLLRPLPFEEPDRLVTVWESNLEMGLPQIPVSAPNYFDWVEQNGVFEELAAIVAVPEFGFNFVVNGEAERVQAGRASANIFTLLGANPIQGRGFLTEEDRPGGDPVVIISDGLWRRRFGSDPGVIGQTAVVDGVSRTIVGVASPAMNTIGKVDAWIPMGIARGVGERYSHEFGVVGRLKTGVSLAAAQVEMKTIASRLESQYPDTNTGFGSSVQPMSATLSMGLGPVLWILLGAVGVLLLIACANVANMLLARSAIRGKEMALRAAIGASRGRIVRQLLTESVVLSVVGGAIGLVLAGWSVALLRDILPDLIPRLKQMDVDVRVLAFTFTVSLVTGALFGLVPAISASRTQPNDALKAASGRGSVGSGTQRARSILLTAEIALALMLAIGAGLLVKSFSKLMAVDPGLRTDNILTAQLNLPNGSYNDGSQRTLFFDDLLGRVKALPGVEAAGAVVLPPLRGTLSGGRILVQPFRVEGQPEPGKGAEPTADFRMVTPEYFSTIGIPLRAGRYPDERDTSGSSRVVVVNETLARRYFPNDGAIGGYLLTGPERLRNEIVGIVGDAKLYDLDSPIEPAIYQPYAQNPIDFMTLLVRSGNDPTSLIPAIRAEVRAVNAEQPLANVRTMKTVLSDSLMAKRLALWLLGIFAALALTLAMVGVYGLTSYAVTQRTREFGLRMALGAREWDVLRAVLRNTVLVALSGAVIGLAGAVALSRVMSGLLFGVTATDPVVFMVVPLLLIAVAGVSSYIPARRATKLDPVVALRYE